VKITFLTEKSEDSQVQLPSAGLPLEKEQDPSLWLSSDNIINPESKEPLIIKDKDKKENRQKKR
jgi:hypothetical protein